jgi:hypothetical protein
MDVHIGDVRSEVRAVDERGLLSPDVLARIVDEVTRAIDSRSVDAARRDGETQLWGSVRSGSGR